MKPFVSFVRSYYRFKLFLSLLVILTVGSCIARLELDHALNFDRVLAVAERVEVLCYRAGARAEGPCEESPPRANRLTYLQLAYLGSNNTEHHRWMRCATEVEKTVTYIVGQQIALLVDRRNPENIYLAKCGPRAGPPSTGDRYGV